MAFNCAHELYDNHMPCPYWAGNANYNGGFRRSDHHLQHIRQHHKSKVPDTDPSKTGQEQLNAQQPQV